MATATLRYTIKSRDNGGYEGQESGWDIVPVKFL